MVAGVLSTLCISREHGTAPSYWMALYMRLEGLKSVLKSSEVFDSSDLVQGVWLTLADDDILPEEIGHGVLCEYVEIVARLFRKGSDSMLQEDNLEADN